MALGVEIGRFGFDSRKIPNAGTMSILSTLDLLGYLGARAGDKRMSMLSILELSTLRVPPRFARIDPGLPFAARSADPLLWGRCGR
jgi:hypothetical protein